MFLITNIRVILYFNNDDGEDIIVLKNNKKRKILFHFVFMYDDIVPTAVWCAVESLYRQIKHKGDDVQINIWMTNPDSFPYSLELGNVVVLKQLNFTSIVENTPLWDIYNDTTGRGYTEGYVTQNMANAARLAVVYKYGGYYLDGDFVVVSDPTFLKNGVGLQHPKMVNNAFFNFEKGSNYLLEIMEQFSKGFKGDKWGNQGPHLFTRIFYNYTSSKWQDRICVGCINSTLNAWSEDVAYPIYYSENKIFFGNKISKIIKPQTVMVHLWNKIIKDREREIICEYSYNKTAIGILRSKYCPNVYKLLKICNNNDNLITNTKN